MRFPQDVPHLTDGVVTLRAHREADLPAILETCQDRDSVRWTSIPSPYSLEDAKEFVRHVVPSLWEAEEHFDFAIELAGSFAGTCTLRALPDRRADIGYVAHPAVRGAGVMERALRLLLDWGFANRGFETVSWWAHAGNWASRRVAWKLGFSCEGPLPRWLPQRGELRDAWFGVLGRNDLREPRHRWYDAPRIDSTGVVLRTHMEEDLPRIVSAMQDERSRRWLRLPDPYTASSARDFVFSRTEAMATGTCVHWAIADPVTDDLLGVVNLFDIEHTVDAEIGFWTHPDTRGRGVMTEACRLAVRHAFIPEADGGLGLQRVTAYAATENTASLHVIESVGFTRYGVERRGVRNAAGVVSDLVCHDLLADEWSW